MKVCPQCRANNLDTWVNCGRCGASLGPPSDNSVTNMLPDTRPTPPVQFCTQCGAAGLAGSPACPNCGCRFPGAATAEEPGSATIVYHAPMPRCLACGVALPMGLDQCPNCAAIQSAIRVARQGTALAINRQPEPWPAGASHTPRCPHCGAEQGQKVSAIVQAGSWPGGAGVAGQRSGALVYSGKVSTSLVRSLTPPRYRDPESVTNVMAVQAGFVIATILGVVAQTIGSNPSLAVALMFAGPVGFAAATLALQAGPLRTQRQALQARHVQAMQTYDRLYYCSRCDVVYDPQSGHSASTARMYSLL